MTTFSVSDFFSKKFENDSTSMLLSDKLYFSESAVIDYVVQIQKIAIKEYIQYLAEHPILDAILSNDLWYLSAVGYIFPCIDEKSQRKYLALAQLSIILPEF